MFFVAFLKLQSLEGISTQLDDLASLSFFPNQATVILERSESVPPTFFFQGRQIPKALNVEVGGHCPTSREGVIFSDPIFFFGLH